MDRTGHLPRVLRDLPVSPPQGISVTRLHKGFERDFESGGFVRGLSTFWFPCKPRHPCKGLTSLRVETLNCDADRVLGDTLIIYKGTAWWVTRKVVPLPAYCSVTDLLTRLADDIQRSKRWSPDVETFYC